MKLSLLALTVLLTSPAAFAQDGSGAFGDGSPPNTYIAGQYKQAAHHTYKILPDLDYGAGPLHDGSRPNTYIAGQNKYILTEALKKLPDNFYGRNAFGDGASGNNYVASARNSASAQSVKVLLHNAREKYGHDFTRYNR